MPVEIDQKLKMFTPTMPDRDALIFAAGRASAKPSAVWKWISTGLLASQLTLAFVYFMPSRTRQVESFSPNAASSSDPVMNHYSPQDEPYSYIALLLKNDVESTSHPTPHSSIPDRPNRPLTAGMRGDFLQ